MFRTLYENKAIILIKKYSSFLEGSEVFLNSVTIFILSCFVGYYVVLKVSPALHASLMSITNAISGIIIVGAFMISDFQILNKISFLGFISMFLASINIFGGIVITHRMVKMFRKSHQSSNQNK